MDQSLQLLIEMKDKLSKPLTDQQKALRGVNQQIKDLIGTQKKHEQALRAQAKETEKARKASDEWSKAVGAEMSGAASAAAAGVAIAAVGLLAFAGALVYATAKTVEFVTAQSAMGEKLQTSFILFTRDMEQAGHTRDMIDDLAARMKIGPEKMFDTAHKLLEAGIKPQLELQQSVRAVSELQKTGNESAAQKLQAVFARNAQTRRTMGGRGFAGMSRQEATEVLGVGGWEALQENIKAFGGKAIRTGYNSLVTSADVMNKALAATISGGKVGDAARKMVGGFPELIARLDATIRRFFQDIKNSEGFQAFMKSLHGAIDVIEAFTKSGANGGALAPLNAGFKLLAKGVEHATIWALELWVASLKLTLAIVKLYVATKNWLKQADHMRLVKGALIAVALVFGIILLVVGAIALALGAVVAFMLILPLTMMAAFAGFVALFAYIYSISDQFKALFSKEAWKNAIADWINGLIDGITNGVKLIESAGKAVGDALKKGVKVALDAHSPSREMMRIGAMASQGFQLGLDNGKPFTIGAIQPNLAGGGGRSIGDVTIEINIQGSTNMSADELKPLVSSAFADAFEQLQLEMG